MAALLVDPARLTDAEVFAASVVSHDRHGAAAAGVDHVLVALNWLAVQGVRIVNISLAGPYNKLLERGLRRAVENGMLIIAAVGNEGPEAPPRYPAALATVIAVTAVDADQRVFEKAVRGAHVDVAAPGVDLFVAAGASGAYHSGTSFATPIVTALLAANPTLTKEATPQTALAQLTANAVDLGAAGHDEVFGAGLVQARSVCSDPP